MFHLFGSTTPTGQAFLDLTNSYDSSLVVFPYSRHPRDSSTHTTNSYYADFVNPESFYPAEQFTSEAFWVSLGPIWLFASFFETLANKYPERLAGLSAIAVCSSSSVLTKHFAFNSFDRDLAERLLIAENKLLLTCRNLGIKCFILRPTLIYGQVGAFCDSNISLLVQLLRRLPFLPIPAQTGLRQPIHASQLASVIFHLCHQFNTSGVDASFPECIALGGDKTLTYHEMITSIQKIQPIGDSAHQCRLVPIPNRLFYFFAAPLLLFSPKSFEALLRTSANLSGFTTVSELLGCEPCPFPVQPLS